MRILKNSFIMSLFLTVGCAMHSGEEKMTFQDDLVFLRKHVNVVLLTDEKALAQVVVVPEWQGRVVTSTASGEQGLSFGWINRDLIASGKFQEHINVFGGEDRFWLGPEGGQYSIFFKPDVPFDFDHWFTPAEIDTEPFELISKSETSAQFEKEIKLTNYSGNVFELAVGRNVKLLLAEKIRSVLGISIGEGIQMVGFETENQITNTGSNSWTEETGLLSIWILGMFNPSPQTTVVVPFQEGPESRLGKIVTDDYFGAVSSDRLKVEKGVLYFRADGQSRGKIGVSPLRAKPFMGSYDEKNGVLTIVHYTLPEGVMKYVNSLWEFQNDPFSGDAANSYNDGPLADGSQLGPFYELESSSPAAALAPGEIMTHIHQTFHFIGDDVQLDFIAVTLLGVSLDQISSAF